MKATISGIRGVVGKDLTLRDVLHFCSGFAGIVQSGRCFVGRDTRPSGAMLQGTAMAALMGCGVRVHDLGVVPTPVVFRESRGAAGLVVTSSHNPIEWNGLKFVLDGRGINQSELDEVVRGRGAMGGPWGSSAEATTSYLEDLHRVVGDIPGSPAILVDGGGGAASKMAPAALEMLGCRTGAIRAEEPRPDPTAGGLERLVAESSGYDAGVAFDMDGDRMVLVMNGVVQPPDATLGLGVAAALDRGHRTFVLSADTSVLVERYILERGGRVYRSPVGEANVVGAMADREAGAGGEGSSAGFILPGFNRCRDGMLAAGLVASMIPDGTAGRVLDEVTGSAIIREKVSGGASTLERMEEGMRGISSEVDTADGIRAVLDESSWVLVRASNTEDAIRISAEAGTFEECSRIVRLVEEMAGHAAG